MLTTKTGSALFGKVSVHKQKTMKIRIQKDCIAGGKSVKAGAIIIVTAMDAKLLIGMKKAEPVVESKSGRTGGKGQKVDNPEAGLLTKMTER
ncbi:hypothetical protein [Prosthecochloris sp.]|uniref:hypothetical protein n=1 Tax=Prosthecochloris sp. TaxID=290513 RepID=UPI0025CF0FA7|nr:hypothetical protein [Prosthecochloris sp.]